MTPASLHGTSRSTPADGAGRFASLRRQLRLVALLDAAEAAGLTPLRIVRLHAFAYLSNVLAPVWDMPTLDGKILKRHGGPFYPAMQHDLDRLVGIGLVVISSLSHVRDAYGHWRLEGAYRLHRQFSDPILAILGAFEDEQRVVAFVRELAYALSALSDADLDLAVSQDATYSDPLISIGNVVDFDEWKMTNYSANVAQYFARLMPSSGQASPGEKLHLYIRHLRRRIHGGG